MNTAIRGKFSRNVAKSIRKEKRAWNRKFRRQTKKDLYAVYKAQRSWWD